ncbi:MAG: hypothetical protein M3Q65_23035 [Chloroflexota bacterium]|nr:hypothetical protein [Chloroflexota bacterium]
MSRDRGLPRASRAAHRLELLEGEKMVWLQRGGQDKRQPVVRRKGAAMGCARRGGGRRGGAG